MKGKALFIVLGTLLPLLIACDSTYKGKLAVKGPGIFAAPCLVTSRGDLKLEGPLLKELSGLQGKFLHLKGSLRKEEGERMPILTVESILEIRETPFSSQ